MHSFHYSPQAINSPFLPSTRGLRCAKPLGEWLSTSADALFVIGLCVIGFLKLTFLGLLRFEIREMIQKIKVSMRSILLALKVIVSLLRCYATRIIK